MKGPCVQLSQQYNQNQVIVSFELFPPKTEKGLENLLSHVKELAECTPDFITCTYGAGGSTQGRTLDVLKRVIAQHPEIPVASHLTCVNATQEDLHGYIQEAQTAGVSHIVALRGDPPEGQEQFTAVEGGLAYGNELVAFIKEHYPELGILVGGYPEVHPEAVSPAADLDFLKRKVDAGADVILTQLFYDNDIFFRFRDACSGAGIKVPVVPGVLPITRLAQIKPDRTMFGSKLPDVLVERMMNYEHDTEGQFAAGVYQATRQVEELVEGGVPGVHFYVLNCSRAAFHICHALALGQVN